MSKIGEDRQIALRQQLLQFRESEKTSLAFPPNLSNLERKFVHRVATELGLHSSSSGSSDKRFITVQKKDAIASDREKHGSIPWEISSKAANALTSVDLELAMQQLERFIHEDDMREPTSRHHVMHRRGFKKLHDIRHQLTVNHRAAEAKRRLHPDYDKIHAKRHQLPASHHRLAVCKLVQEHQIVLVSGETGCGKSTQVPQFLLDSEDHGPTSRIIVTQPRRISAVSLAERIAYERCEDVGESVGYNIRMEHKLSDQTQLLYVTPGVLLRKLLLDPDLDEYSHVIVDEAHERDRFTEFLLILLRDLCARKHSLKLVLMSATMHTDKLRNYFGDIPQINVGGSVFPVQEFFLEHVLKFTNFVSALRPGQASSNDFASTLARTATRYQCSVCAAGPFLSPEELGTHAAFCFGSVGDKGTGAHKPVGTHRSIADLQAKVEHLRRTVAPAPGFEAPARGDASKPAVARNPPAAAKEGGEAEELEEGGSESDDDSQDWQADIPDAPFDDLADVDVTVDPALPLSEEVTEFQTLLTSYQRQCASNEEKSVDYDLIVALLKYVIHSEFGRSGAVLVFLPGWDDIHTLHRMLTTHPTFADARKFLVLQLHSGIPKKDQQGVFQPCAPGVCKIVLATNIAETSLTIDDVSVVIDTGLAKEKTYDAHTKLSFLKCSYISQAAARQRKGRAGRTRAGVCFRLFSLLRSKHLSEFQDSELLRMPLEELVLQAKSLGVAQGMGSTDPDSIHGFLQKAMDPPSALSIQHGVDLLQALHALDDCERLTRLGEVLAHIPMNPRLGKMMLLGCVLGAGPAIVSIASILSYRDPFLLPTNEQQQQRNVAQRLQWTSASLADAMAVHHALEAFTWKGSRFGWTEAKTYCDANDLSFGVMQQLKALTLELDYNLQDIGISCRQARCMTHEGHVPLLTSLLSMGMYPCVAMRRKGNRLFVTEKGSKAKLHGSSINSKHPLYRSECRAAAQLLCYQELVEISPHSSSFNIGGANYLMRCTTPISWLTYMLICGEIQEVPCEDAEDGTEAGAAGSAEKKVSVVVDHWLGLQLSRQDLELIHRWRDFLSKVVLAFVEQVTGPNRSPSQAAQASVLNSVAVSKAVDKLVEALEVEHHLTVEVGGK